MEAKEGQKRERGTVRAFLLRLLGIHVETVSYGTGVVGGTVYGTLNVSPPCLISGVTFIVREGESAITSVNA